MVKKYIVKWSCETSIGTKVWEACNQTDALMQTLKMITIGDKVPNCKVKVFPVET